MDKEGWHSYTMTMRFKDSHPDRAFLFGTGDGKLKGPRVSGKLGPEAPSFLRTKVERSMEQRGIFLALHTNTG